jgi:hypothetical protein
MTATTHLAVPTPAGGVFRSGDVRFVTPGVKVELSSLHASAGLLEVDVATPPWASGSNAGGGRGGLRQAIDHAIERALEVRGARAPGIGDLADLDQSLSDQLYRARLVGSGGLVVHVPSLAPAANLAAALDAEDSAVLRWWIAAVTERPVVLLLHEANRSIGVYGPPTRLDLMVKSQSPPPSHPSPHARSKVEPRPAIARNDAPPPMPAAKPAPPAPVASARPAAPAEMAERHLLPLFPRPTFALAGRPARDDGSREGVDWRMCANDLRVARGPKPLTMVERLFISRYVPLTEAIAAGDADDTAREVADQWAESFARSYTEGFSALRVTGKRPRMVLDAPQLLSQIARLHGAKSAQLVLVDGMRFDLGVRVHDRMRAALASHATCTERLLLWAALPTTTSVQLDLLAHGAEGLASRATSTERDESGPQRARTPATLRRMRVGNRDLMRLDWVGSRLREAGPPLAERLDTAADEMAPALVSFARSLPPRTLMFVFGDHGFRMATRDDGTLPAAWGGASPEEVLVPGFAWLVGDVH